MHQTTTTTMTTKRVKTKKKKPKKAHIKIINVKGEPVWEWNRIKTANPTCGDIYLWGEKMWAT